MKGLSSGAVLVGVASLAVIVAIGAALTLVGPPGEERLRRADHRRVEDLQNISRLVDDYRMHHPTLPASIEALASPAVTPPTVRDPFTNEPYEYRVLNDNDDNDHRAYELCARFQKEGGRDNPFEVGADFWAHGVGRQCFKLEAHDSPR